MHIYKSYTNKTKSIVQQTGNMVCKWDIAQEGYYYRGKRSIQLYTNIFV